MRPRRLLLVLGMLIVPTIAHADTSTPIDLAVSGIAHPQAVGVGEPFTVEVELGIDPDTSAGATYPAPPYSLTWSVTLPSSAKMLSGRWPGPVLQQPVNCLSNCVFTLNSPVTRGYDYRLVASAPGDLQIAAQITATSNPDPDKGNNSASAVVKVEPLKLKVASVSASPARAGRRLTWVVGTASAVSGLDVHADHASCAGRLGSKATLGKATVSTGKVTCAWLLPSSSHGQKLAATVHVGLAAATASLSRTFHVAG